MKKNVNNISVTEFVKDGADMKDGFANYSGLIPARRISLGVDGTTTETTTVFSAGNPESGIVVTKSVPFNTAQKLRWGLGSLGAVAGILVAVKRKSGFWGGAGWWILGGMAGSAIGWVVTSGMKEDK